MASLTFPIVPEGLVVDVAVNLEAATLLRLLGSGGGPAPIQGRGLRDTGSDVTGVALPILQQLGNPPIRQTTTQGIGGSIPVNIPRVSLHILNARNLGLPWPSQPALNVLELAQGFPLEALIGLDVLLTCKLIVDGPAGYFTLEF